MTAVRFFTSLRRRRLAMVAVAAALAAMLAVAGGASAKAPAKPPGASAVSQYVEMLPGAGGAGPSSDAQKPVATKPKSPKAATPAAADPVNAAFATRSGKLGGGALLAIILGSIAACGAAAYAVRRRLSR